MKRITRSLLSLCLAFVLCAALLPNTNAAKVVDGSITGEETSVPQTKEPTFLITGYEASRSSIETGDAVSITVYLSRTDGRSDTTVSYTHLEVQFLIEGTAGSVLHR